ncbi:MAG: RnfABCDGE type electron transport complex subunit G [Bacteroidales bacterium]|jgi:electron transport complex protein RnfG|nr:RnfABCDGE type electron transport complex subunit G [Bacteroidales bacterium]
MAKKESTFINMVLTLFMVTLVASAALGYIYELTKDPIAASKLAKQNNAIKQVVPDFDNEPGKESYKVAVEGDSLEFFPAKKNNELVGTAVSTFTNKGFSGNFKLMVGFLPDGTIHNISVLEHKETPGLGDKMQKNKSDWSVQFNGKNPADFQLKVTKDGGDVDAITASTITSRAFCDAVERAYNAYMEGGKQ